jgi:hypothetical protein
MQESVILVKKSEVSAAISRTFRRFYDEGKKNLKELAELMGEELSQVQQYTPEFSGETLDELKEKLNNTEECTEEGCLHYYKPCEK